MKGFLLFCLLPIFGAAQTDCEDPFNLPDTYYQCFKPNYNPVCGCDGKDYRNACAAEHWGGLLYWSDGVCGDFDMDIYPTVIKDDPNGLPRLSIYMKYPGTASLTIFNAFGNLMYEMNFSTGLSFDFVPAANPYELYEAQTFPRGIYIVIVTVNGNKKYRKIIRATE
jgi:hypothetical protein